MTRRETPPNPAAPAAAPRAPAAPAGPAWRVQHESGSIIEVAPRDAAGTRRLRECGYHWVNQCDGLGWRPTVFVLSELEMREYLAGARG